MFSYHLFKWSEWVVENILNINKIIINKLKMINSSSNIALYYTKKEEIVIDSMFTKQVDDLDLKEHSKYI
jgi:hypothetical protein